jgi:hypothetical protein
MQKWTVGERHLATAGKTPYSSRQRGRVNAEGWDEFWITLDHFLPDRRGGIPFSAKTREAGLENSSFYPLSQEAQATCLCADHRMALAVRREPPVTRMSRVRRAAGPPAVDPGPAGSDQALTIRVALSHRLTFPQGGIDCQVVVPRKPPSATGRQRRLPRAPCDPWPVERPRNWAVDVSARLGEARRESLRESVDRGRPLGSAQWVASMRPPLGSAAGTAESAKQLKIESTMASRKAEERNSFDCVNPVPQQVGARG